MTCLDLSNYDYDHDVRNVNWPSAMKSAGVTDVIIGTQWPDKAREQATRLRYEGVNILGFYAEPDWENAISLCREFDVRFLGLACEPGSIQSLSDLRIAVNRGIVNACDVHIYGNQGDLTSLLGTSKEFSKTCKLWLANYGADDPNFPREPIEDIQLAGWTKVSVHQYSSTIVVAGRVRDHNYLLEEPDLTPSEVESIVNRVIDEKLRNSQLIDSSQIPELVAQILGVHDDTFTDQSVNSAIRAKLFPPPGEGTTSPSASAATLVAKAIKP